MHALLLSLLLAALEPASRASLNAYCGERACPNLSAEVERLRERLARRVSASAELGKCGPYPYASEDRQDGQTIYFFDDTGNLLGVEQHFGEKTSFFGRRLDDCLRKRADFIRVDDLERLAQAKPAEAPPAEETAKESLPELALFYEPGGPIDCEGLPPTRLARSHREVLWRSALRMAEADKGREASRRLNLLTALACFADKGHEYQVLAGAQLKAMGEPRPSDEACQQLGREICLQVRSPATAKALYTEAYVLRGEDPEAAKAIFEQVVWMTSPEDETNQRALARLRQLTQRH